MFITVECESCKYSFEFLFGYGGIAVYQPYKCNDCKRYFIARFASEELKSNRENPFRDIKAIAIYDEDNGKAETYTPNWIYCKECGGHNIEKISIDDVIYHGKIQVGQSTKTPCLICGKKLKCIDYGIFDG